MQNKTHSERSWENKPKYQSATKNQLHYFLPLPPPQHTHSKTKRGGGGGVLWEIKQIPQKAKEISPPISCKKDPNHLELMGLEKREDPASNPSA